MRALFKLAWRNLWRQKRRTWITIGAMIFSNLLLVFMISLQFGSYEMMIENSLKAFSGQMQIARTGYDQEPKMQLAIEDIESLAATIRRSNPSLHVAPRASTFVLAASEQRSLGILVSGVDPDQERKISSIPNLIIEGRYLTGAVENKPIKDSDNRTENKSEIVVGQILAKNLKITVGDELTMMGSGFDGSFAANVMTVVGIFKSSVSEVDRNVTQLHLHAFQETFAMGNNGHSIIVNGPVFKDIARYQADINKLIASRKDTVVLNWAELNPSLQQSIEADFVSSWFMYGVLIILVAFSVLNTQLMSVLERTREFGIMMAIGFNTWRLSRLVLLESTLMALLGLAIGTLLGLILAYTLSQIGISFPGMEDMVAQYNMDDRFYPKVSFISILLGPTAVFIGCILAAIYPALRLHFLEPVTAMHAV